MQQDIFEKIKTLKAEYSSEGFIILGVFGSFARGEENEDSDIDILFEVTDTFLDKYAGWKAFGRLEDIKFEIQHNIGKPVDMADRDALDDLGRRFILPEVIYVS
jgi:predicted nucleotidyltransferase